MEENIMEQEFAYIYNSEQGIFFITNGLIPVDFGTGNKGDAFIKFNKTKEYKMLFDEWCNKDKTK